MSVASGRILLLATLTASTVASDTWAQEWRASARFGRVTYESAPSGASAASSVVLGLGRTGLRDWLGASAALPLGEEPFWVVLGGWKRLETRGRSGLLLDLSGHGFFQRHTATNTSAPAPGPLPGPVTPPGVIETDLSGEGLGAELLAGGFAGSSSLRFESRAGVAAQTSRLGDVLQDRMLPTADARLALGTAPFILQAETRTWLDHSDPHTYVGSTLKYVGGPLQLWGSVAHWVTGGVDRLPWSVGASTAVGPQLDLMLGGRGNAFDPLYLSSTETSVWAGLSLHLGGSRTLSPPVPARTPDGQALIRIAAHSVKGRPSIAGDFTRWKPVPLEKSGSHWIYQATLAPGVYHYSFVAEDGTWFVPKSMPGRQDDGMGGHVAVLVVS